MVQLHLQRHIDLEWSGYLQNHAFIKAEPINENEQTEPIYWYEANFKDERNEKFRVSMPIWSEKTKEQLEKSEMYNFPTTFYQSFHSCTPKKEIDPITGEVLTDWILPDYEFKFQYFIIEAPLPFNPFVSEEQNNIATSIWYNTSFNKEATCDYWNPKRVEKLRQMIQQLPDLQTTSITKEDLQYRPTLKIFNRREAFFETTLVTVSESFKIIPVHKPESILHCPKDWSKLKTIAIDYHLMNAL